MNDQDKLQTLVAARLRITGILTALMVSMYFGFVALVGFNKPLLAHRLSDGLSLGIVLGALVIVLSWITTWIYVHWANTHYDPEIDKLRKQP